MATIKRTIEEKAKRYDEILERAKEMYARFEGMKQGDVLEDIFPELKVSGDAMIIDRIKEAVTYYWSDEPLEEMLAWLEKQGKNNIGISEATKQELENNLNKALEKETPESWNKFLGEQKSTDKVEPKFKIGDWVVNTVGDTNQVVKVFDDGYTLCDNTFLSNSWATEHYRLWTIQDANDGDVLYNKDVFSGDSIFIYKGISDKTQACLNYTRLFKDEDFSIYNDVMWENGVGVIGGEFCPATKEQRDTLFAKMKEAGYEWDAEKKELKKTSQRMVSAEVKEAMYNKPTWSEEDEKFLDGIIANLEYLMDRANTDTLKQSLQKRIDWLKHLKERYTWKPSDEQIDALEDAIADAVSSIQKNMLNSLYQDIKKLKG